MERITPKRLMLTHPIDFELMNINSNIVSVMPEDY